MSPRKPKVAGKQSAAASQAAASSQTADKGAAASQAGASSQTTDRPLQDAELKLLKRNGKARPSRPPRASGKNKAGAGSAGMVAGALGGGCALGGALLWAAWARLSSSPTTAMAPMQHEGAPQQTRVTMRPWQDDGGPDGDVADGAAPCNMKSIDASGLSIDALAALLTADEPAVVRNAMAQWSGSSLAELVAEHGGTPLEVVRGARLVDNEAGSKHPSYTVSLAEHAKRARAGFVARDEYVFTRVSNSSLAASAPHLCDLLAKVMCVLQRDWCVAPTAARGTLNLIFGADGSGNALHTHGPALNSLLEGSKEWVVPFRTTALKSARGDVQVADLLAQAGKNWARVMWRCTQNKGEPAG